METYHLTNPSQLVRSLASSSKQAPDLTQIITNAKKGNVDAYVELGRRYVEGCYVERNVQAALALFKAAAMTGNSEACKCIAQLYRHGNGVDPEYVIANYWDTKAISPGIGIGWKDVQTNPEVHRNCTLALCYFHQLQEKTEQELLTTILGGDRTPLDTEDAFKWLCGEQPDITMMLEAMLELGIAYETGHGVSLNHKLRDKYLLAVYEAAKDDPALKHIAAQAVFEIAKCNRSEHWMAADSLEDFKKAADLDHLEACFYIGSHSLFIEEQEKYLKRASELGHPMAALRLLNLYRMRDANQLTIKTWETTAWEMGMKHRDTAFALYKHYKEQPGQFLNWFNEETKQRITLWLEIACESGHPKAQQIMTKKSISSS